MLRGSREPSSKAGGEGGLSSTPEGRPGSVVGHWQGLSARAPAAEVMSSPHPLLYPVTGTRREVTAGAGARRQGCLESQVQGGVPPSATGERAPR